MKADFVPISTVAASSYSSVSSQIDAKNFQLFCLLRICVYIMSSLTERILSLFMYANNFVLNLLLYCISTY